MRSVTGDPRMRTAAGGAICLAAVVLAGILLRDIVPPADEWVLDHAYAAPGSSSAAVATAISGAGTLLAIAMFVVGALAVWRRHRGQVRGLLLRSLALAIGCGSVLLLQWVVLRPGPLAQSEADTYPSGHATVVTAIAIAALFLYGALGRAWRRAALGVGLAVVLLVSASRVVLAEHWLIDVVAAIVGAVGVGLLAAVVLRIGPARPGPLAAESIRV